VLRRYRAPMGLGGGWFIWVYLLVWLVVIAVVGFVLYFVLRKAIAHGIRDARRAEAREGLASRVDAT
jgi:Na+/H+ antiporter NhaD/arsenite permease-like protein